jgi:predicted short-subunit dehydrogenase-like oxidoreductase (DUF2520 family)
MKIVLIGAGNLATNLGVALLSAGHDILQVYSRTMKSASILAEKVGGSPTNEIKNINSNADVYILSVKDSILSELIPEVCKGKEKRIFIHTAGSVSMDIFKGMAYHYGVLYPMQTFSKDKELIFNDIPCFVEANDKLSENSIMELANSLTNIVYRLSSEDRKHLHLAAVFASNFVNHCYSLSSEILKKHNIPFEVILPLIDETANKVHKLSPSQAQTGPAVRFDENVLRNQSLLLKGNPLQKDIYDRMSLSIHQLAEKNNKN